MGPSEAKVAVTEEEELVRFFTAVEQHKELMESVHVMVPVRPTDGINNRLAQKLSIWQSNGVTWSLMNDHMGGFIEVTRARMAYDFLGTDYKYLLMLDNDMEPPVDLPWLLVRHQKPFVGACCLSIAMNGIPQLCFTVRDRLGKFRFVSMHNMNIPAHGLIEVGHVGTGALMVRRDVFEAFTWDQGDIKELPFYVSEDVRMEGAKTGTLLQGEDLAFCNQVRAKGFKMLVDLEAHVGHRKITSLRWPDDQRDPTIDPKMWVIEPKGNEVQRV